MDNLISREAAIAELMKMVEQHMTESARGDYLHYTGVKAMLEYLPAVDAVPVVRCEDCEYSYYARNRVPSERATVCDLDGRDVPLDWYCAHGERRKKDGN